MMAFDVSIDIYSSQQKLHQKSCHCSELWSLSMLVFCQLLNHFKVQLNTLSWNVQEYFFQSHISNDRTHSKSIIIILFGIDTIFCSSR